MRDTLKIKQNPKRFRRFPVYFSVNSKAKTEALDFDPAPQNEA